MYSPWSIQLEKLTGIFCSRKHRIVQEHEDARLVS